MSARDEQLVAAYLDGDDSARDMLERYMLAAAKPFRSRLVGEWDDLLQDLRLELTAALQQRPWSGDTALTTYVWRVVERTCIDRLRRNRRRNHAVQVPLEEFASTLPSPHSQTESGEVARKLYRLLRESSEDCRELWHRVLAGQSYQEMSEILGVAIGTLRVRLLRCRRALWAQWQEASVKR